MSKRNDLAPQAFAELIAATNFSFLRGGSHAHELVAQAKALGHTAIGIADRNSLAGMVRAHIAAKQVGLRLLVGARLVIEGLPGRSDSRRDRAG
ncbi:MAG: PHP domain-containing protein, partial [Pseudomonadota bacterium]